MADETATTTLDGATAAEPVAELRPCSYCGEPIHPASHRCVHCGGHVGLAWGTVHGELFLFLFLAVAMVVGCLASWTGRTPVASATSIDVAKDRAEGVAAGQDRMAVEQWERDGSKGPRPEPMKRVVDESDLVYDTVGPSGAAMTGLDTLRGTLILAIAAYGILVSIFNLLYRRLTMWPFVVGGLLALWTGLQGVVSATGSPAADRWKIWASSRSLFEQWFGKARAIPPGHLLLTMAGIILMVKLVGGVVAAGAKGKPKSASDAKDKPAGDAASRRRKKDEKDAKGDKKDEKGSTPAGDAGSATPTKGI